MPCLHSLSHPTQTFLAFVSGTCPNFAEMLPRTHLLWEDWLVCVLVITFSQPRQICENKEAQAKDEKMKRTLAISTGPCSLSLGRHQFNTEAPPEFLLGRSVNMMPLLSGLPLFLHFTSTPVSDCFLNLIIIII